MPRKPGETRGGNRPRAGRPKGVKNYRTRLKERIEEDLMLRNSISKDVRSLLPLGIRKTGLKKIKDIAIEELEKDFKARVGYRAHLLLNAQMSLALGQQLLYRVVNGINEKGKPERKHVLVTDPDEISRYLDDPTMMDGNDYYYITTKTPDNNAINSVLDRLFGKASTKVVGANNPDGSEGPIKVVVANFSPNNNAATQPIIESVVADVLQEEESVAQLSSHSPSSDETSPDSPPPDSVSPYDDSARPDSDDEVGYNVQSYGT